MKIMTADGTEIHAPRELVSVMKTADGHCSVWVAGTAMGSIDADMFTALAEMSDDKGE